MVTNEAKLYWHNRPEMMIFGGLVRNFDCINLPRLGYVINDPALATKILKHPAFSSSADGAMGGLISPIVGNHGLFNMDGEEHRTFKQSLMRILNRSYVETVIEATLPLLLEELKTRLCAGETIDFVAFTQRMTTRVMLYLAGIEFDEHYLPEITETINQAVTLFTDLLEINKTSLTPGELENVTQHLGKINYLLDEHGSQNEQSLLYKLRDMGLSEDDARGLLLTIIAAGTETTNVTLPRILALLLDYEAYHSVQTKRDLLPQAIEEGIRVTSASPVIIRAIIEDASIDDYHFKAGKRALLMVYNFMKSSKYLDNSFDFNLERSIPQTMKHLSFGHGAHFCLGFPLAIREIDITLQALMDLNGTPRIIKRSYPRGETFPGYKQLFIKLEDN